ncbi:hypothetical protein Bind_1578 [Beijerinckia indica subsp. indica ATCC 9039]|uniref:Uncharacterized protein n=2 Tax=Beijerinckia TaxID=532 RepID=B2IBC6_BEII9|nr:hypothetical protein Bind_1578 [Beijerinckia indica subsp. indica ATCC 9039]
MRSLIPLLSLTMMLPASSVSALDCRELSPTPPQNTDISSTRKLNAAVDGLFKKLAGVGGSAEHTYRTVATSVIQQFPNASSVYMWERILYLQCQTLADDKSISKANQLKMISELYGKFAQPPEPIDRESTSNSIINNGNNVNIIRGVGNSISINSGK